MCCTLQKRWILSIMALCGAMNLISLRINLSSAIVEMVDVRPKTMPDEVDRNSSDFRPEFSWDPNQQGFALGSYFYGYTVSQIIAAWCGRKFGRARTIGICSMVASILTMMTPQLLRLDFGVFIAARICIGALWGSFYTLMHGLWGIWSPVHERGKHLTIQFAGSPCGSILFYPLCGFLSQEYGWQYPFLCTGSIGFLWSAIFLYVVFDSPKDHPTITPEERNFIESSIGNEVYTDRERSMKWLPIFKSPRVWCVTVATLLEHTSTYLYVLLPTYLHEAFYLDVKMSSSLSFIPYLAMLMGYITLGWLVDHIIAKGYRTSTVRKLIFLAGNLLSAISLIMVTQVTKSLVGTLLFFCLKEAASTVSATGIRASAIDMAPGFSGVIFALCNSAGAVMGFVVLQYAGIVRQANSDDPIKGWIAIYLTAAASCVASAVCFLVFGPVDVEEWAKKATGESETTRLVE